MADSVTIRAVLCADGSEHSIGGDLSKLTPADARTIDTVDHDRCGPHCVVERTITTSPWVKVEEK